MVGVKSSDPWLAGPDTYAPAEVSITSGCKPPMPESVKLSVSPTRTFRVGSKPDFSPSRSLPDSE